MIGAQLTPLQFGMPGGMELAVILLIAVLLFGANKIPKLARATGQAMGEFQRGREEIEQELDELEGEGGQTGAAAAGDGETQADSASESASAASADTSESTASTDATTTGDATETTDSTDDDTA